MNLVEIVTPSSNVPVTISLQEQCDDQDQGAIGCDFLRKEHEVEKVCCWFDSQPFDIKRDLRIGRLLPLPPKKVELGASTTLSNIPEGGMYTNKSFLHFRCHMYFCNERYFSWLIHLFLIPLFA